MGTRIREVDRASLAGIPANEGNRIPRRSISRIRGTLNAGRKIQLRSKAIVGNCPASHPYNNSSNDQKEVIEDEFEMVRANIEMLETKIHMDKH